MAQNTVAAGRAWLYSHNIGRNGAAGMGFAQPVGVAATADGTIYVTNRGSEQNPGAIRVSKVTIDQEFITEFGRQGLAYGGDEPSTFTWLTGVTLDKDENVYVSDEWQDRIAIFDKEGNAIGGWGEQGDGEGQLNGASGLCFDDDDNLWVVSSRSGRIQKFSKDGKHLGGFGGRGDETGKFDMPYGITMDPEGNVYIADWNNNRVQKLRPDGTPLLTFGADKGAGALDHPTGVCVDNDGDVYVVDWINERVVIYNSEAKALAYLHGDAVEMSKWGMLSMEANPDAVKARRRVDDLVEQQKRFRMPTGCTYDRENNRLIVVDTQRSRLQIYEKDASYMDPQFNL